MHCKAVRESVAKGTGYVKNRFIGENSRLISNVIELYEKKKTCQACYRF